MDRSIHFCYGTLFWVRIILCTSYRLALAGGSFPRAGQDKLAPAGRTSNKLDQATQNYNYTMIQQGQ
ncbi:MAG: hypothetical protein JPMHGGIA_02844 [Saprospiraceae bacterium]|jgi:hypothetical protein|nr:hypothetical protein [Saprospiraceae bacterium]